MTHGLMRLFYDLTIWRDLVAGLVFPAAIGAYTGVKWIADTAMEFRALRIAERQEITATTTALLQQSREQLLHSQAQLEASLHEVDRLRQQGWKLQDAVTGLHAAAVAARVMVHRQEAEQQHPLTAFSPLPTLTLCD